MYEYTMFLIKLHSQLFWSVLSWLHIEAGILVEHISRAWHVKERLSVHILRIDLPVYFITL